MSENKAIKSPRVRIKKGKAPKKERHGGITRRPADCACVAGSFRTIPWGTPVVEVLTSQGFTILTVKVRVKFQFTCENVGNFCRPVLTPHLIKTDFGGLRVVTSGTRGGSRQLGPCDGQVFLVNDEVCRFFVVLSLEIPNLDGRLELRFTLDGCAGVVPRDMFLVISGGKLDDNASDYDGDGKTNADPDELGREWDPNR